MPKIPYGYDSYNRCKQRRIQQITGWSITDTAGTTGTTTVTAPKPPPPPPVREGDRVRVETDGLLNNRVGQVSGFMLTEKGRLAFVSWPGGGWSTFFETQLKPVGKKPGKKESKDGK
jgi:hypothetical protein